MDDDQHRIQDACEAYAVYVMQKTAEELGVATAASSGERWAEFIEYLRKSRLTLSDFETGEFGKYKRNTDLQVPNFVSRLKDLYRSSTFDFENVERDARNEGMKADVHIHVSGLRQPIPLSIKNYIGGGGITRPQVSSGTFLSFACGFVFDRIGVGQYEDPRPFADKPVFQGSNAAIRAAVLEHEGRPELKEPLARLEALNAEMRADLLADDCEMYDQDRVRAAVTRCADIGIAIVLDILEKLGNSRVREKFLARIGMDGKEESLFFDADLYVDSITNPKYHQLREKLNDATTTFSFDLPGAQHQLLPVHRPRGARGPVPGGVRQVGRRPDRDRHRERGARHRGRGVPGAGARRSSSPGPTPPWPTAARSMRPRSPRRS